MPPASNDIAGRQHRRVIEFLGDPQSHHPVPNSVERLETHGAIVFLAGGLAYKIKKAVRFDYMDFSTLELRRRICLRELELNRPHAPDIYLDVVAITQDLDGRLAIGGTGEPIEWCVRMRRFAQSDLLSTIADNDELDPDLCRQLAAAVVTYHRSSPVAAGMEYANRVNGIADDICRQLHPHMAQLGAVDGERLGDRLRQEVERVGPILRRRGQGGFVRRVHGDLHLGNIVLWEGKPVLFDAIEFNEDIATIDTLHDLAFLLMDLDRRGQRAAANRIMNHYLWLSRAPSDIEALAALPLFLSLRAGVRAMVSLQRAMQKPAASRSEDLGQSIGYLRCTAGYLEHPEAALIAVGGYSGTGKSTLAAALAPHVGAAPGALLVRSDLERKALFNCAETQRLAPSTYTSESSARVYAVMLEKAESAVRAGQAVIVDAVFARQNERAAVEQLAQLLGVPFRGLWLEAPPAVLRTRVAGRRDDASDATVEVVDRQLARDTGPIAWTRLASGESRAGLVTAALAELHGVVGRC